MPKQEFPFPMPDGWFCVLRSHELENGEVQSVKFCENEVAAFRTESGKIGVLDAYCGYSGINLAKDGMVSGENLVCKQHGIKWDTSGACADIETDSNVPETAKEIGGLEPEAWGLAGGGPGPDSAGRKSCNFLKCDGFLKCFI